MAQNEYAVIRRADQMARMSEVVPALRHQLVPRDPLRACLRGSVCGAEHSCESAGVAGPPHSTRPSTRVVWQCDDSQLNPLIETTPLTGVCHGMINQILEL